MTAPAMTGESRARSYSSDILRHINLSTACYGPDQPVRILLLSLYLDRHKLCKIHHTASDIQSKANSDPIDRRLHRVRLRHSLKAESKRLFRPFPNHIFFMGSTAVMDELVHFEPCLPIGAHIFRPPMSPS